MSIEKRGHKARKKNEWIGWVGNTCANNDSHSKNFEEKIKLKCRLGFHLLKKCAPEKPVLAFSCWKGSAFQSLLPHSNHSGATNQTRITTNSYYFFLLHVTLT